MGGGGETEFPWGSMVGRWQQCIIWAHSGPGWGSYVWQTQSPVSNCSVEGIRTSWQPLDSLCSTWRANTLFLEDQMFGIVNYCRVHSLGASKVDDALPSEEDENHWRKYRKEITATWAGKRFFHGTPKAPFIKEQIIKLTLKETRMLTPKVKNTQFIQTRSAHLSGEV